MVFIGVPSFVCVINEKSFPHGSLPASIRDREQILKGSEWAAEQATPENDF